jgi:hypothetical protein
MARRTKEGRGSRPKRRAAGKAKEVIHRRAYWFDRARSLSELQGRPRGEPGDGRGLVGRYTAAVNRPIGELACGELHMMLTQGTDPHFLVPVALDRLSGGVGREDRALLGDLLRLPHEFWRTHPFLRKALSEVAVRTLGTLREGDGVADDEALEQAIEWFLDRAP